jgi:hypothetical protein
MKKTAYQPELWPVYEFRPRAQNYYTHRFADGQWIPDDGEYDLAFARKGECLMVELPYHENIIWSWCTGHWGALEANHPRGNAWHYMLRDGADDWGNPWGRDLHANSKAGRSGMDFAIKGGCSASGRHVEFHLNDKHIAAGLLREQVSKNIITFPETPICMHCGALEYRAA